MTSLKPLPWRSAHRPGFRWSPALRRLTATGLQVASAALARLAVHVAVPIDSIAPHAPSSTPTLEFYAEAGAPEGALYLDGELVGWLTGIRRL